MQGGLVFSCAYVPACFICLTVRRITKKLLIMTLHGMVRHDPSQDL